MSYKYGTKLIKKKKIENKRKRRKREGIEWASAIKVWQVAGIHYTQEFSGGDNVIVGRRSKPKTSVRSRTSSVALLLSVFSVFFFFSDQFINGQFTRDYRCE